MAVGIAVTTVGVEGSTRVAGSPILADRRPGFANLTKQQVAQPQRQHGGPGKRRGGLLSSVSVCPSPLCLSFGSLPPVHLSIILPLSLFFYEPHMARVVKGSYL